MLKLSRWPKLAAFAVAVAAVLILNGCSSTPTATPATIVPPTSTVTATSTAAPVPTATAMPTGPEVDTGIGCTDVTVNTGSTGLITSTVYTGNIGSTGVIRHVAYAGITDATGAKELSITPENLGILKGFPSGAYQTISSSFQRLFWQYGKQLKVAEGSLKQSGDFTRLADNNGYYLGECVSAAKALAGSNFVTGDWTKGKRVTDGGVAPGTILATFSAEGGTKYPAESGGHVVIFRGYLPATGGSITAIEVWDQNWDNEGVMGLHKIFRSGSGVINADNYNVVLVPLTDGGPSAQSVACGSAAPLSDPQLADLVRKYFPDGIVTPTQENIRVTALAVALAESSGNPTACGDGDQSIGLWQINMPKHEEYTRDELMNPEKNAEAAVAVSSNGSNWNPWCTWEPSACGGKGNMKYKDFLPRAKSALN